MRCEQGTWNKASKSPCGIVGIASKTIHISIRFPFFYGNFRFPFKFSDGSIFESQSCDRRQTHFQQLSTFFFRKLSKNLNNFQQVLSTFNSHSYGKFMEYSNNSYFWVIGQLLIYELARDSHTSFRGEVSSHNLHPTAFTTQVEQVCKSRILR